MWLAASLDQIITDDDLEEEVDRASDRTGLQMSTQCPICYSYSSSEYGNADHGQTSLQVIFPATTIALDTCLINSRNLSVRAGGTERFIIISSVYAVTIRCGRGVV